MINSEALEHYMASVWQSLDDAKASIKNLENFIDSMEDKDCKEEMKVCCVRMDTEINNAVVYAIWFDMILRDIRKVRND